MTFFRTIRVVLAFDDDYGSEEVEECATAVERRIHHEAQLEATYLASGFYNEPPIVAHTKLVPED